MANTINIGEMLPKELTAAGIPPQVQQFVPAILNVLRAHDETKRLVVPVTRTQFRAELADRTVPDGCLAASLGVPELAAGENLLHAIDFYVETQGTVKMKELWKAPTMEPTNSLIPGVAQLFGYDESMVVDLFLKAKTI